jgi:Ion channel
MGGITTNARYIYTPYFLYSLLVIPQLQLVLRTRSKFSFFKVTNYFEKLTILLVNILQLIFLGLCVFNFFENNFGNNLFTPKNTITDGKLSLIDSFYFMVITMSTVGYGDISPKTSAGYLSLI